MTSFKLLPDCFHCRVHNQMDELSLEDQIERERSDDQSEGRSSDDDQDDEMEVLVEHKDKGNTNRRIVKFGKNLESLKRAIIKVFDDILVVKIAHATGLSHSEVREAKSKNVLKALHLQVYNEKYKEYIDVANFSNVENGAKIVAEVNCNDLVTKKSTSSKGKSKEEDEIFDIALEFKSVKLHFHVHEGKDHRFLPYWWDPKKMTDASGPFPPGTYKIWCPVYLSGQGYICLGSEANGLYEIELSGGTNIEASLNITRVKFTVSPNCELCTRIMFVGVEAYLCYQHSTGKVFGMKNPKPTEKDYELDFQLVRAADPFKMYWQIFNEDGQISNGISHYLSATKQNSLNRVKKQIDTEYKDPSSLFAIYRESDGKTE